MLGQRRDDGDHVTLWMTDGELTRMQVHLPRDLAARMRPSPAVFSIPHNWRLDGDSMSADLVRATGHWHKGDPGKLLPGLRHRGVMRDGVARVEVIIYRRVNPLAPFRARLSQ